MIPRCIFDPAFPPSSPTEVDVSVVIPAHNRPKKIQTTLNSLSNQKYENFEIIVVHSGNNQVGEILERMEDIKFRIAEQPGQGASNARNVGLEMANGEIVAFTDDDCRPPENWIASIVWMFQEKEIATVGGTNWPDPSVSDRLAARIDSSKLKQNQVPVSAPKIGGFELNTFGTSNVAYDMSEVENSRFRELDIQDDDGEFQMRILKNSNKQNAYMPVPTWHMKEYNFFSYLEDRFNAGRSSIYKDVGRTNTGSALGMLASPALLTKEVVSKGPILGFGSWLCDMCARAGVIYEMTKE